MNAPLAIDICRLSTGLILNFRIFTSPSTRCLSSFVSETKPSITFLLLISEEILEPSEEPTNARFSVLMEHEVEDSRPLRFQNKQRE